MQKSILILFGLFISSFLFSQILTTNSGASLSIAPGSSISLGGLDVAPADTFVISSGNAISRSSTSVTSGGNSSVSRVYNITGLFSDFTGTLTFSYLDGELNGIDENTLRLELQADDDSWSTYEGVLNPTANTVSYTFNEAISFKAVTASAANATLTVEDLNAAPSRIVVYPNPTADRIYIQAENITKAVLFDLMGRRVRATSQDQIDLSDITSGSYILQVTTDNNTKSFKIIKQ